MSPSPNPPKGLSLRDHHREWRGYFAAAPTPFDRDGALDAGRLREVLAWFLGQRAHGLVVNGTTGEWVAQSVDERQKVLEIARGAVGAQTPLLVGISSIRPDDTVILGRHAAEAGADGALLTIPPARWLRGDEIFDFYAVMARQIPLPVLVYNVPAVVGYDLPTDLFARLLTIDGIVGVKDNTPSQERRINTLRELGEHHAIFSDVLEATAFPVFAGEQRGRGQIGSGMPLGSRLADAFELTWRGETGKARLIVDDLTELKKEVLDVLGPGQPWHAQIKALMFAAGIDAGFPRFPATSVRDDESAMAGLVAVVEKFGG
ncbi:dihydrodipicolinate synthase family protein [Nonomuraea basaltis]|uniref:dihydrodipicolinate synthase family protein n=1 Tax=Nonomuraea basaltis TaxID=2495887 RepID=UPI00110C44B8|nr:dihydrodipicolinate synthase family protein [Nonomuraea basaltis]TMR93325.1 dihydrodipicolinate synthase family protein [Nonomuraea basaltis]